MREGKAISFLVLLLVWSRQEPQVIGVGRAAGSSFRQPVVKKGDLTEADILARVVLLL